MIRRPPRSTLSSSSAASDVYKRQIKTVFKNFDKDNSGFIDINEIVLISKELGQEVKEEEVQRIFKDLDINKDGKISFDEFWDWWQFGRSNKLEKLVFFKLKAMNLLNQAHSEFVRMGGSLESKYDKTLDNHYIAFNMGESKCGTDLEVKVNVNNEFVDKDFNFFKEILSLPEDFFGLLFKFKSLNAKEMASQMQTFMEGTFWKQMVSDFPLLSEDDIKFQFQAHQEEVVMAVHILNPMISQLVLSTYQEKFLDQVGENFYLNLELQLGLMKSLKQLFDNFNEKFVAHFMQGFIVEFKLNLNSGFLKSFRNLLITVLENKVQYMDDERMLTQIIPLFSLIYGSKVHVVFKDMEDVNKFFQGLGVEDLLEEQPSTEDMLQELKENFLLNIIGVQDYNELKEKLISFAKFIEFFQNQINAIAEGQINFKLPKTFITLNYRLNGLQQLIGFIQK
eukprot:TRINITY_DN10145_c0_g1_i1.p1 TRINITY_DN10145_c0_g1~~TRINITY_DN10145_c0_g1_i1.p1  ORF type:complete len:451 (-),score=71.39 TRINITY_DN10145_c0_g1_i1:80-1432(-)